MSERDRLSTRWIARQERRMSADLGSGTHPADGGRDVSTADEAWKALIATALRRNVVVAVGDHRSAIEAEAVTAALDALAKEIEGLPWHVRRNGWATGARWLDRKAVLALLEAAEQNVLAAVLAKIEEARR